MRAPLARFDIPPRQRWPQPVHGARSPGNSRIHRRPGFATRQHSHGNPRSGYRCKTSSVPATAPRPKSASVASRRRIKAAAASPKRLNPRSRHCPGICRPDYTASPFTTPSTVCAPRVLEMLRVSRAPVRLAPARCAIDRTQVAHCRFTDPGNRHCLAHVLRIAIDRQAPTPADAMATNGETP